MAIKLAKTFFFILFIQVSFAAPPEGKGKNKPGDTNSEGSKITALAVLLHDASTEMPCTENELTQSLNSQEAEVKSANNFYQEVTFGEKTFEATVVSLYISSSIGVICNLGWMDSNYSQQLIDAGYNLNQYDQIIYYTNRICGYEGFSLPDAKSVHVDSCSVKTTVHEIGHKSNLDHASTFINGSYSEYTDFSDVMGGAFFRYNAPHLLISGYLPSSKRISARKGNTYRISPLYSSGSKTVILAGKGKNKMYVSYRDDSGIFDKDLFSNWKNKVYIHTKNSEGETFMMAQPMSLGESNTIDGYSIYFREIDQQGNAVIQID